MRSIHLPRGSIGSALTWPQVIIRQHQLGSGEARLVGHGCLVEHPFQVGHGVELQSKAIQREDRQATKERTPESTRERSKDEKDKEFDEG